MNLIALLAVLALAGPEDEKAAAGERFLETSGSGSLAEEAVAASPGPWEPEPLPELSSAPARGYRTAAPPSPHLGAGGKTPVQAAVLTAKGAVYGGAAGGVGGSVFGPGGAVAGAVAGAFLGALAGFLMGGKPIEPARRRELEELAKL